MGFWGATTQVTRYKVDLGPGSITERLTDAGPFRGIEDTADELSFGWTSIDDLDDVNFWRSPVGRGALAAWSLRVDVRKVKPAILGRMVKRQVSEEAERSGKLVSRDRRMEIREQVRLRLLAKTLPESHIVDMVYSHQDNMLYVFSNNRFALLRVEDMITATFHAEPERLTPGWLARHLVGQLRADEVFGSQIIAWDADLPRTAPSLFLAWMLRHAVEGRTVCGVKLEYANKATVEKHTGSGVERCAVSGIWGDDPMRELLVAMSDAKQLTAASLVLYDKETDLGSSVRATSGLELTIKTPRVDVRDTEDADGLFLERFYLLDRFFKMWDGLYQEYLNEWSPDMESMIEQWATRLVAEYSATMPMDV